MAPQSNTPSRDGGGDDAGVPDDLSGRLITVYVGPNKDKWILHLNLFMRLSKTFQIDFGGRTQDLERLVMSLDADPRTFEMLVSYAYSHVTTEILDTDVTLSPRDGWELTIQDYVDLYSLAGELRMEILKDDVMAAVIDYYGGQAMRANT